MSDQLSQLRAITTVVADTGDIQAIQAHQPQDATTNPSLLLQVATQPELAPLLDRAKTLAKEQNMGQSPVVEACEWLSALVGQQISEIVPGYVSTEVDARLSFDTKATIETARRLIKRYEYLDVDPSKILIKIASTYEGIQAAKVLEAEGITCNMTLIFHLAQAIACAEAGATLISPFVGRISDWYKKQANPPEGDQGVASVKTIYHAFKSRGYPTIVMGASFRSVEQILALAGVDRLTIAPNLLEALSQSTAPIERQLSPDAIEGVDCPEVDEPAFRWALNQSAMATELLSDGINRFAADQEKLEALLS